MPKPRPPYLQREISRHGKITWYVRKRPMPRIRINGVYGSREFMAEYHAALADDGSAIVKKKEVSASLSWLIARYRESASWSELSHATHRQRENIFKHIIKSAGDLPYQSICRADIVAGRDKRRETPSAANNFLGTMRGLFQWALEAGFVDADPTTGVRGTKRSGDGFHVWSEDEINRFESKWPIGSRERLALSVLLFTGLRRGDAARLGRQHIKDGVIQIRTEKTNTLVTIPILPALQSIMDASATGDLAIIARHDGQPMTKEGFANWFKTACVAAGVPGSAHGLRKAGATRAAEAGATIHELNAIFGWTGTQMASLYTEQANRTMLAQRAIGKLAGNKK